MKNHASVGQRVDWVLVAGYRSRRDEWVHCALYKWGAVTHVTFYCTGTEDYAGVSEKVGGINAAVYRRTEGLHACVCGRRTSTDVTVLNLVCGPAGFPLTQSR